PPPARGSTRASTASWRNSPASRALPERPSATSSPHRAAPPRTRWRRNGCPVRTIHLARLDEHALGALLMHFMLETVSAAHLLGADPFDQLAAEEGKVLAKQYLAEGSS